jgi:hypothetical protein
MRIGVPPCSDKDERAVVKKRQSASSLSKHDGVTRPPGSSIQSGAAYETPWESFRFRV